MVMVLQGDHGFSLNEVFPCSQHHLNPVPYPFCFQIDFLFTGITLGGLSKSHVQYQILVLVQKCWKFGSARVLPNLPRIRLPSLRLKIIILQFVSLCNSSSSLLWFIAAFVVVIVITLQPLVLHTRF